MDDSPSYHEVNRTAETRIRTTVQPLYHYHIIVVIIALFCYRSKTIPNRIINYVLIIRVGIKKHF